MPDRPMTSGVLARLVALVGLLLVLMVGVPLVASAVTGDGGAATTADDEPSPGATAAADEPVAVTVYFGRECPNCAALHEWFDEVGGDLPIEITYIEVWHSDDNRELFRQAGRDLDFEADSVPVTVIDRRVWIGNSGPIHGDIRAAIELVLAGEDVPPGVYGTAGAGTCQQGDLECATDETGSQVEVPLIGTVNLDDQSLLVSTLIIGFVDGVNPCSLWVISVLLTIVVRTASRRRVIAIGSMFLLVTAGMYALYMAGIYSVLNLVGFLKLIQVFVAVVAGVFGVVSVKDYFAFKKGLSFTIPDSAKPGIYKRVRAAAGHERLLPALAATVALGVAVSLIETPCTAGFPVLWTGLLKANNVGWAESAALFVAYMVPFLLDEMIVFGVAVFTMKATKMQEEHGELLKLFAGVTMLALASVMAFVPELMENPLYAALLFAAAFLLAWGIHVVTLRVKARRAAAGEADHEVDQEAAVAEGPEA
jgi:glutaredoxin